MYRSVDMQYLQVLLPSACAEDFVDRISRDGSMQFTDLNETLQPFQRPYTGDIILVQDVERQVKGLEELLKEYKINVDTFLTGNELQTTPRNTNIPQLVDSIAKEVSETYSRLNEQAIAEHQLRSELESQQSLIMVLSQLDKMVSKRVVDTRQAETKEETGDVAFRYFAGVVSLG